MRGKVMNSRLFWKWKLFAPYCYDPVVTDSGFWLCYACFVSICDSRAALTARAMAECYMYMSSHKSQMSAAPAARRP
jgi:uncharacterized UBP type Zn finger protein